MWTIIILGIITIYVLGVLIHKIKKAKKGEFCSCGCENCGNKCKACQDMTSDNNT